MSRRRPRILLDECIDRRLGPKLEPYQAKTVPKMGWAGLKNGQLLTRAQAEFDVFITVDRNLSFQQNVSRYDLAIIVLRSPSNRLQDLLPLVPKVRAVLDGARSGTVLFI